jgi:hypothetical protein
MYLSFALRAELRLGVALHLELKVRFWEIVGIERHSVDCTFLTFPTVPDVLYGVPAWVVKVDEV